MKLAHSLAGFAAVVFTAGAHAALLSEGFDDVTTLPGAGWVQTNNSTPVGTTGWFQGNAGVFASQAGAANAYIAANFNNSNGIGGGIDNWLISPELALAGGGTLTFYTRTADAAFGDVLQVLFNAGSSSATADFTTSLLTVGDPPPYPDADWMSFSVALPSAATGRFAVRYLVPDSGNADFIGIDSVRVDAAVVPEPESWALLALGVAAMTARRHRRAA